MKKALITLALSLFFIIPQSFAQYVYRHAGIIVYFTSDPPNGTFAHDANLRQLAAIARDNSGNLYVASNGASYVYKINAAGIITTVAGNGTQGNSGDGGPATNASFGDIFGLAVDASGNVYVADRDNEVVRKISTSGIVTKFAGTGVAGFSGDGGPATAARLREPTAVATDASGNLYISDSYYSRIRKVSPSGTITTFAGNGSTMTTSDAPVAATSVGISAGYNLTCDGAGNVYFGEGCRIRKINTSGIMSTYVGSYSITGGYSGDGGPATSAAILQGRHITVDPSGNLYFVQVSTSSLGERIRKVTPAGIISTYAGSPVPGTSGDGGPALSASFEDVWGLCTDLSGNLCLTEYQILTSTGGLMGTGVIRKIVPTADSLPTFTGGLNQTLSACSGVSKNINSLMTAKDADVSQTLYWSVAKNPLHGTLSGIGFTTSSTGTPITPTGMSYTSTSGYTGPDTFKVRVYDGLVSYVTTVAVQVDAPITVPAITGGPAVCQGATISLSNTMAGGTWLIGDTAIAVLAPSSGVVTGVMPGSTSIGYAVVNGCGVFIAAKTITVNVVPTLISGIMSICPGTTTTLSSLPSGGSWSCSATSIATIGSSSGVLSSVAAGTAIISYTFSTGCGVTGVATINPMPLSISLPATMCVGSTSTLSTTPAGGTWVTGSPAIAAVGLTSGVLAVISPGSTVITYATTAGCITTTVITTDPSPSPILGSPVVCEGATITLSNSEPGGTWSSGSTSIATIGAGSGIVDGLAAGTSTVTYALSSGCSASTVVSVNPAADAGTISGLSAVCAGATMTLTDGVTGGTWSSASTSVATVGAGDGIVSGVAAGVVVISYTVSNSCGPDVATITVSVNPLADAGNITGSTSVCEQNTIVLSNSVGGGVWSASNGNATVSATGVVTGITTGTTIISYAVTNSCGTTVTTATITVAPGADCQTGISEIQHIAPKFYPNPTGGVFTLELPKAVKAGVITITDVLGKIVEVRSIENNDLLRFDLSDKPAGNYVVKIATDGTALRTKLVISK